MSSKQIIMGGIPNANLSTTGTMFYALSSNDTFVGSTTNSNTYTLLSAPGTISKLNFTTSTAPVGATSYILTFYQNGSATSLVATVAGANTNAVDITHTVTIAAGDRVCLQVTVTGTPAAAKGSWSFQFEAQNTGETQIYGGSLANNFTTAQFIPVGNIVSGTLAAENRRQFVMPTPGTLKNFFNAVTTAPGAGTSWIANVHKNGSNSGTPGNMVATISGTNNSANDLTNSIAVVAGDLISVLLTATGSPAATTGYLGFTFVPDRTGEFVFGTIDGTTLNTGATSWSVITGRQINAGNIWNVTEALTQIVVNPFQVTGFSVNAQTAPGAGTSYAFMVRQNRGNTSLVGTLSGTNTQLNATRVPTPLAQNDIIDMQSIPAGTPGALGVNQQSYVGYIAPSDMMNFLN